MFLAMLAVGIASFARLWGVLELIDRTGGDAA
jgi:hypothetical protein